MTHQMITTQRSATNEIRRQEAAIANSRRKALTEINENSFVLDFVSQRQHSTLR
jgi:hypothetical protein